MPWPSWIRSFSIRRACPSCSRSFAELDPRLFSYNSRHGWCGSCFGTGEKLQGFDARELVGAVVAAYRVATFFGFYVEVVDAGKILYA